jgi:predicted Zn finger-like uncharacterized protein
VITDCPSCYRQYRVYAWQLSAAKGLVQCGYCSEQFNAVERLYDRPLSSTEIPEPIIIASEDEVDDEPHFEIPAINPATEEIKVVEQIISEDLSENSKLPSSHKDSILDINQAELSQELLKYDEKSVSIWRSIIWSVGILTLMLFILVQLAWFNRDWLLNKYPEYRPFVRQVCNQYDCELIRKRDLTSIVLLNRDVRDHPRYFGTLLVNATIENQSDGVQPYPGIRLVLYDTDGTVTGYRVFKPPEYLDVSVDLEKGMPAKIPLHLVLEITGDTDTAVSFEFHFI